MSAPHETEIKFRGVHREIAFEHEGDGVIVWWFLDDKAHADAQRGATPAEQDRIYEQLWAWLLDHWAPSPDDDR